MAHIVEFRAAAARETPDAEGEPERGAQIIIFPGVRRERHVEPVAKTLCQHDHAPKRDVLELPD